MISIKTCSKCGIAKTLDEFYKNKKGKYGKRSQCKECCDEKNRRYYQKYPERLKEKSRKYRETHVNEIRERKGVTPMDQNKLCTQYLGVVVGERLCRHLFKDVEVMPNNNTGFDIICNRGKKIDVKAACTSFGKNGKNIHYQFRINKNVIADFFIFVAFDNRKDLNPLHLWMIPGSEINFKTKSTISPSTIHKWDKWKRDIKDAQLCCNEIKKEESHKNSQP